MASKDPTTQSNYLDVHTTHISLDWHVDFDKRIISGSAVHRLNVASLGVKHVIFDTLNLNVREVTIDGQSVKYSLGEKHEVMGSALVVPLPPSLAEDSILEVAISYATTPESIALQWLTKEQTQGKTFPYLFSQCQPIYARSLLPVQDSPSVKITYDAQVTSLLPALLSAIRVSPPSEGPAHDGKVIGKDIVTYKYNQPVAIPSYLIAIAAGDLRYSPFTKPSEKNWNSGIWTEPSLMEAAFWEFSEDTTRFLAAEEGLVGDYRFGTYDLLVLPPSFPYGGMENACLSFLNPTLLAGDRSLVDVVVHELTHSWFGNGVTHAHASHFWLNEGWTTYMERVLQQILHGSAERSFSYVIGNKVLQDDLERYADKPKYRRLVVDFEIGEDPDEAYSSVPYEKGANLLLHLERTVGGLDVFLPYIRNYVESFSGKSIATQQWKDHLYAYFRKHGGEEKIKALDSIDWDAWFYGEGVELPAQEKLDLTLAEQAYVLADRWDAARAVDVSRTPFVAADMDGFNSNQKVVFLQRLQSLTPLPATHITHLGDLYGVRKTSNAEIRFRFYQLALLDPGAVPERLPEEAAKWVVGDDGSGVIKGRAKFCRPVFRSIAKIDRTLAVKYFEKHKTEFHPIARKLIEKDIGIQ